MTPHRSAFFLMFTVSIAVGMVGAWTGLLPTTALKSVWCQLCGLTLWLAIEGARAGSKSWPMSIGCAAMAALQAVTW
jgi:hypothetical protein